MQIQPFIQILSDIIHECTKRHSSSHILRICAFLQKNGLASHSSFGSYIVSVLVRIGNTMAAENVFERLTHCSDEAWNALIRGHIKCGKAENALSLYQRTNSLCCGNTDAHTYVDLLKTCTKLKKVDIGVSIHGAVSRLGLFDRDLFVGSALVDMYAKCDSMLKAQQVFDSIPVRNNVLWNALIAGYAERGEGDAAIKCFEKMELEGIPPSAVTYVCCLKACGNIKAADKGEEIHKIIEEKGLLENNSFIGSTLVDLHVKCGNLEKARKVLDQLPMRNIFAWTALIAGYAENSCGEEALICFHQMELEGTQPNYVTYICALKACGSIKAIKEGQEMHAEIERKRLLERDLVLSCSLIDMYSKCNMISKAHEVFKDTLAQDVRLWNSVISAFAENGHNEEVLMCLSEMQLKGILPDDVTLLCSIKACGNNIKGSEKGFYIHAQIAANKELEGNHLFCGALLDMYAKSGLLAKAQEIFHTGGIRNIILWNTLISGYVENGKYEEGCQCFDQMQLEGFSPDVVTFIWALKACAKAGAAEKGIEMHGKIEKRNLLEEDIILGATLMEMYIKCGLLRNAQDVFDQLPTRNIVLWNILITGYAENGHSEEALQHLDTMHLEGIEPDLVTLVCSLKACSSLGAIGRGFELHADIERKGFLGKDLVVGSSLVDMYAKCALITTAQKVFDQLPIRDTVSWNALIAGYCQIGESENVFLAFDTMLGAGLMPDPVTFIIVLNMCSRTGLYNKSQTYFETMGKEYGIIPTFEHHACIIDLLGRTGHLEMATAMIMKASQLANVVVCRTLLSACKSWGSLTLGRHIFERATEFIA